MKKLWLLSYHFRSFRLLTFVYFFRRNVHRHEKIHYFLTSEGFMPICFLNVFEK